MPRTASSSTGPSPSFQLTQAKLADMTLELGKGMLLALHLGRLKDAHTLRPEQISLGKLNNVREAIAIARECRTILGANGISLEYSPSGTPPTSSRSSPTRARARCTS